MCRKVVAGILLECDVAVQEEDVRAAGNVAELLDFYGDVIKHDDKVRLRHGRRAGIVDIGDHESLDAFAKSVDCIGAGIAEAEVTKAYGIEIEIGIDRGIVLGIFIEERPEA